MRLNEIIEVPPKDRTARHWRALGRNHGLACVARLMRDGLIPERDHRAYLLAVIAGQHRAGLDVVVTSSTEWNYYLGFIESLNLEKDVSKAELSWYEATTRQASA